MLPYLPDLTVVEACVYFEITHAEQARGRQLPTWVLSPDILLRWGNL
jgi:hypothetical protein